MATQVTETRTVAVEHSDDDETHTLGAAERAAIKRGFTDAAERAREIAARAQKVGDTALEPEMYCNLAEELRTVADGVCRIARKGEQLVRDEDSGPIYIGGGIPGRSSY